MLQDSLRSTVRMLKLYHQNAPSFSSYENHEAVDYWNTFSMTIICDINVFTSENFLRQISFALSSVAYATLPFRGLGENSLDNLCYDFGKIVKMFNDVRGYLREAIEWRMPMDSFTIDEVSDFHTAPVHFNMIHGLLDVRTVGGPDFQKLISKMWSDYYGRLTTHSPATVLGLIENRSRLYFVNARKKLGL
ncbi:hypothetical protein MKW92_043795 [Papaver armeniacum]|nr:hypothetical protein MKW92_043795 [Papaver armeniacum]